MLGEGGAFNPANVVPQLPGMTEGASARFFNAPKPKPLPKPKEDKKNKPEKVFDTPVAAMGSLRSTLQAE
eukprot:12312128-Alexandrium_andersonii.AAC.1